MHHHQHHHPLFSKHLQSDHHSNSNHLEHSNQTSINSKYQSTSTSQSNFSLCYLQTGATLIGHQTTIRTKTKRNHQIRSRSQSQSHLPSSSSSPSTTTSITRTFLSNQQLTIDSHLPIIPSSTIFDQDELYLLQNSSLAPVQVPNLSFGSIPQSNTNLNYSLSSLTTTINQPIHHLSNQNKSNWEVKVIITEINLNQMKLKGIMEAKSEVENQEIVLTSWKGEIIDFDHHFLFTNGQWANEKIEKEFWSKTKAFVGFKDQLDQVEYHQTFQDRIHQDFVLMRWKETHFVNCEPDQSGLSIQGFYFVCQSKSNGLIEAFYYDPSTTTLQRLTLKFSGSQGIGFGCMNLA